MAGAYKAAIFNTYRRTYHQILYWLPPLVLAYVLMDWATERWVALEVSMARTTDCIYRNEYLNSKPGRLEAKDAE